MRKIQIFFNFSKNNTRVFLIIQVFCKSCETEIVCRSKNQNKFNFMFPNLTKRVNNQTNCRMERLKKIWICLVFI